MKLYIKGTVRAELEVPEGTSLDDKQHELFDRLRKALAEGGAERTNNDLEVGVGPYPQPTKGWVKIKWV